MDKKTWNKIKYKYHNKWCFIDYYNGYGTSGLLDVITMYEHYLINPHLEKYVYKHIDYRKIKRIVVSSAYRNTTIKCLKEMYNK